MAKNKGILDRILDFYFSINFSQIQMDFASPNTQTIYLENGMAVSFGASILYLLTGSTMGLIWLIPKLYGLITNSKLNEDLIK